MKVQQDTPVRGRSDWPTLVIVAVCAATAGVLGTLLWVRGSEPRPAPAAVASSPAPTGASAASGTTGHAPPPEATAGMTPVQASVALGNWYYDHEAWPSAIENYQKAIAQGMDVPDIRTDLGSAYRFNGQPQKALEQYAIAQKQDPKHEASLFNAASVHAFDLHEHDKATALWDEYLTRFPKGKYAARIPEVKRQMQEDHP